MTRKLILGAEERYSLENPGHAFSQLQVVRDFTITIKRKVNDMLIKKEHQVLPNIPNPEKQLLEIWKPEDREIRYPKAVPTLHNGTEERYYDLSVIIPVYNTGKYLKECVYSVLNQRCLYRIQVIIINDSSTDNSNEILRHFEKFKIPGKDIRIIHLENAGLPVARNAGIALAEGKYLMFLDSDDAITPDCIQRSLTDIMREDADFLQVQYMEKNRRRMKSGSHIKEGIYETYPSMCRIPGFATMKIFRTSLFEDVWFPENYWFEDALIHLRIFPKCRKGMVVPYFGYVYRKNTGGITQTRDGENRSVETIQVIPKILLKKDLPEGYLDEAIRHFTFISYNRLKYLPEDTIQTAFLTACSIIQDIRQEPSGSYRELYEAFLNRDYGIWKWYACRKEKLS